MSKVKIATDWLAACAGCHMSLLDIDERVIALLEHVEFTSSPVTDLKHPPKDGVTVGILTGAISNTHNIEVAKHFIDMLQMLEDKTRNNLTPDEKRLLDQVLYETRMSFVQMAGAGAVPPPAAPAGPGGV